MYNATAHCIDRTDHITAQDRREAARPVLAAWLKCVDEMCRDRQLQDFEHRLACIIAGLPSANVGRCWPGQAWLAAQAGRCERTIRSSLGRFARVGLLKVERGGQGRTSVYVLCIDGKPLFDVERQGVADLDRQSLADLERQLDAAPYEPLKSFEREASSPTPPQGQGERIIDLEEERQRRASKPYDRALDGEVLGPIMTFNDIWSASGAVGKPGPAMAIWHRLSKTDQAAITELTRRNGDKLDTGGIWLCTWLASRAWRAPPLDRGAADTSSFFADVAGVAAELWAGCMATSRSSRKWVSAEDVDWVDVCRAHGHAPTLRDKRGGWTFDE
jgi:hypothetical protein